jgi:sn-glycerol 3-phosphate transport system permease protein
MRSTGFTQSPSASGLARLCSSQAIIGWLLVLPALSFLGLFTHYPIVASAYHSLFQTPRGRRPPAFVGFENYERVFSDPVFHKVVVNNVLYALGTIPFVVSLALAMAIFANSRMRARSFLRASYFLPTVLPMIAVANIWLFFYTPQYGVLDTVLSVFGLSAHNWLGDPRTALPSLMVLAVWKDAGFFMIFYLAALQQLPPDLIEAARLEGANRWTIFCRVTLPLLMPTTVFILINSIINAFRLIDHVIVLTRGGPDNASSLLLYHLYLQAFQFWDGGYASALTMLLLLFLAVFAYSQFRVLDKRTHYR